MKSGVLLLLGVAGAGAALFMMHSAHAASSAVWPAGFTPPGNSATRNLPASNPTGMALKATTWAVAADAGGTQAGTYTVYQSAAAPGTDWAVFFNGSPMAVGDTQNAKLIQQAVAAGLVK
jgi:hypothetical protein